ncbi:sensor histidine kinase [Paenibacillus senegalensis]|uniref:sensor histidine kinase n=1 Tax=Paenibacillus senegalensis TaxID=1465766 RepID=UPI0002889E3E|nr:sensor histidine kinase [Paenibacillus senegalensis]
MFQPIHSFFRRWYGKLSSKIFVKLLILLLASNLILVAVIYHLIGNLIDQKEAETLNTIRSLEHALGRELGDLFNLVTTLTNQLIIEPDLQQILIDSYLDDKPVPIPEDSESELRRLQKQYDNEALMLTLLSKYRLVWNNNIYSLAVVDSNQHVYLSTAQNYQIYAGDIAQSRLLNVKTKENMIWSINDSLTKNEDMITITRKIYGTTMPKQVIGYVVINMSLDEIRDSFDTYKYYGNMLFGLYDSSGTGRMLYDGEEISADTDIPAALWSYEASGQWSAVDYDDQTWKMIKGVVDHTGLTGNLNYLFVGLEEQYLLTMKKEIRDRLLYGYFLFLLLSLAVSFYGAKVISGRIGALLKTMRQFGSNLRTRIHLKGNDEISIIGNTFNVMAYRIEDLLEDLEKEQRMKRMFELRVMEYQINPHFLYNTLDTIHWLALDSNQQQISRMVDGLSKLFRIILSKGKERITMQEEFEMIRIYLDIHKIRLGNRFDYNIQLDPAAADYTIGKLVLQPIVENAIMHGIRKLRGKGLISITGSKRDKYIELSVSDNGVGMDADTLEKQISLLNSDLLDERMLDSTGYGMKNVDSRMKMMFGDRYRMEVHSAGHLSGCTVNIYLRVEE